MAYISPSLQEIPAIESCDCKIAIHCDGLAHSGADTSCCTLYTTPENAIHSVTFSDYKTLVGCGMLLVVPFFLKRRRQLWVIEFFMGDAPRGGDNFTSLFHVLQTLSFKASKAPFLTLKSGNPGEGTLSSTA